MDERDEPESTRRFGNERRLSRPVRGTSEGVRIIGAEEAAAAIEGGSVARRRPDDMPRYGDVPDSPLGPRPARRFPLPDDVDASEMPRPPVAALEEDLGPRTGRVPADLPHWTEPATGEVPRILASDPPPEESGDDLSAWSGFANRSPRWRDQHSDWEEADFDEGSMLAPDEERLGALDTDRVDDPSDPFAVHVPEPEPVPLDDEPAPPRQRPPGTGPRRPVQAYQVPGYRPGGGRDVGVAVGTGLAVAAVALLCFALGPTPTFVLALAVVTLCAVELFDALRRSGYHPATLLGLTATISMMIAAYARGETAIPLVLALTVLFSFLWYLSGVTRARPTANIAVTVLGVMWVGFLGSFAALLLTIPARQGIAFLLGAVICTVASDAGAFFVGRRLGSRPLAPAVSPNKTWEGLLGGMGVSVLAAVLIVGRIEPWTVGSAFWLAVVVGVVAPIGDLCESMIKRDLGIKDMGTLLPGHGGVLDRFDALLFVLPVTYYLVRVLDLI